VPSQPSDLPTADLTTARLDSTMIGLAFLFITVMFALLSGWIYLLTRETDDRPEPVQQAFPQSPQFTGPEVSPERLLVLTVLALVFYLTPSVIAFGRHHPQRFAILMLNIFAGWTIIAWMAAIVWAFTAIDSKEHVHHHYYGGSGPPGAAAG
jgi:hypothetical protein